MDNLIFGIFGYIKRLQRNKEAYEGKNINIVVFAIVCVLWQLTFGYSITMTFTQKAIAYPIVLIKTFFVESTYACLMDCPIWCFLQYNNFIVFIQTIFAS